MKKKVAVCISGETRTWEKCVPALHHTFAPNNDYAYYFFGHTWAQNSWKSHDKATGDIRYRTEDLDPVELEKSLRSKIPLHSLTIDKSFYESIKPDRRTWNSMLYSRMMANYQKQRFEEKFNFKFDLVATTRWDQIIDPRLHISDLLPAPHMQRDDVLYADVNQFRGEFYYQSINDLFYFGPSRSMDLVDSLYRVYTHEGNFGKVFDMTPGDPSYKRVGPGVLLYKWATIKNIYPYHIGFVPVAIVRENSTITDPVNEFEKAHDEMLAWWNQW